MSACRGRGRVLPFFPIYLHIAWFCLESQSCLEGTLKVKFPLGIPGSPFPGLHSKDLATFAVLQAIKIMDPRNSLEIPVNFLGLFKFHVSQEMKKSGLIGNSILVLDTRVL